MVGTSHNVTSHNRTLLCITMAFEVSLYFLHSHIFFFCSASVLLLLVVLLLLLLYNRWQNVYFIYKIKNCTTLLKEKIAFRILLFSKLKNDVNKRLPVWRKVHVMLKICWCLGHKKAENTMFIILIRTHFIQW